jgi:hypothetical protein
VQPFLGALSNRGSAGAAGEDAAAVVGGFGVEEEVPFFEGACSEAEGVGGVVVGSAE